MKTIVWAVVVVVAAGCGMDATVVGHSGAPKVAPDQTAIPGGPSIEQPTPDVQPNPDPIQPVATVPVLGHIIDEAGLPIAGVKIEVVGTTTSALTDSSGAYTLNVTPGDLFLRATEATHKTQLQGVRAGAGGISGASANFTLALAADFDTAPTTLDPPIAPNLQDGVVLIEFQSETDLDGTFGAALNGASFDQTYSTCGSTTAVYITDRGTAAASGGHPLIFSNVKPGLTGIAVDPAPSTSCTFNPPFSEFQVESGAVTHVIAFCH